MGKENSQQYDMFTGGLVETRSKRAKKEDSQPATYRQTDLFAPREVLQFGVKSNPSLPLETAKGLPIEMRLEMQDPRTEEEKEADRMRAAEKATYQLFESKQPVAETQEIPSKQFPSGLRFEVRSQDFIPSIHLDEGVDLPFWTSRDEGYEWAHREIRKRGYIPHFAGDCQLELRKRDDSGCYVITYSNIAESPVSLILNIAW